MKQKYLIIGIMFLLIPTIVLAETINDSDVHPGTLDAPEFGTGDVTILTEEQIIQRQEQIYQILNSSGRPIKRDLINSSNISFKSGHKISVSPGIEQNLPYDTGYYVIQFYSSYMGVDATTRDKLDELDVVRFQYIDDNAFYTNIPKLAFETIDDFIVDKKIRYVGEIPYDAKIEQQFDEEVQANLDSEYGIVVYLFERPTVSQLVKLRLKMNINSYSDVTYFVYGSASGSDIIDIANMDSIMFVEKQASATLSSVEDNRYDTVNDLSFLLMSFVVVIIVSLILFIMVKKRKKQFQKI